MYSLVWGLSTISKHEDKVHYNIYIYIILVIYLTLLIYQDIWWYCKLIITQNMCLISLEDTTSSMSYRHYKDIDNSTNFLLTLVY